MTALAIQPRLPVSPYARRLARERGLDLAQLRGTGPGGRIVAADVTSFVAPAAHTMSQSTGPQASALATTVALGTLRTLLGGFAAAESPFALEDVLLRAAGCALDDVSEAARTEGAPVALETKRDGKRAQLVFADIRKGSLGPLRARRLAAENAGKDQAATAADLSLRILPSGDIRPVGMPLIAGRVMRLVVAAGEQTAECLLSFDAGQVDEDTAADVLGRFKAYLEVPLRLLA